MMQIRKEDDFVTEDISGSGKEWCEDRGRDDDEWGEKLEEEQKEAAASKAIDDLLGHAAVMDAGETKNKWRQSEEEEMVVGGREGTCLLCVQAGESFTGNQEELADHFLQVHNIVDQSLECIECDYKARHSSHLREHINAEHRQLKYYCDLCDFQTKWRNRIKTHKVSVHKEGGLPCPSCDNTASEAWTLSQHVRIVHRLKNGEGDDQLNYRYKCGYCDYRASQKSHLKGHVDAIHRQIMFCCDMCSHQTKWKSLLKSHTRAKHTGLFIYCDHCEYKTIQKNNLKKHIARKHGDIKFACFTCDNNFLTRIEMKKHMGDVHHMEIL